MHPKVALITGASRGIGRQTALAMAEAGYRVALCATGQPSLEEVGKEIAERYGQEPLICCGDLSDMAFTQSIVPTIVQHWGRIDVLVNNAAWRTLETMRSIGLETWQKTLTICVTAPAFLAKACAAVMEEKGIRGVLLNISSVMSQKAGGTSPAYIASKGAMESLTRELAVTYGRSGIRVLSVRPGFIDTELSNDYRSAGGDNISGPIAGELLDLIPLNRPGSASDIAGALVWLSSEQAGYITGCELTIDGGLLVNFSSYPIKNLQFPHQY